jgi:hypothetical protein
MPKTHLEIFEDLFDEAKSDDNIIGFFLGDTKDNGIGDHLSGINLCMIVKDDIVNEYKKKFDIEVPEINLSVMSLTEFTEYSESQGETSGERYNFTHLSALVDKTGGEIQKLIKEKGLIPENQQAEFINNSLNAYINCFYRSVRSYQKQEAVGIRLEAAASIQYLLNALFALHGRVAPFADYLVSELKARPLEKFSWSVKKILEVLLKILNTGDLETQQELFKAVEKVFRSSGYGKVFDDWEGKVNWAANFRSDFKADKI